jgi:hypothetical protein
MLDEVLAAWDEAWAAPDAESRRRLVERALTADAELVDPVAGRFRGHDAIAERLSGFRERFPGAFLAITSGVDEHNGFARYTWAITGADGGTILDGMDVVERGDDGRLCRVVMFFSRPEG